MFPPMRRGLGLLFNAILAGCLARTSMAQVPASPVRPLSNSSAEVDPGDQLRRLEEENRRLANQLENVTRRHDEQIQQLLNEVSQLRQQNRPSAAAPSAKPGSAPNVGGAPDQPGGRRSPVPGYSAVSSSKAQKKASLLTNFGPGFELMSDDEEFQLQIHQETQLDYKVFEPHGDIYARSGFVFPRVRLFFNGRVTKQWEYTVSLNRGLGAIDVLDAFVNYHSDDRLQLKAGRFMTPFNYEQFAIQNMWLMAPERSLFTANLGLNRMLGVQLWGIALEKRLDYAVGVFNGPRNSFEDFNESKDVMSYLNYRPFGGQEDDSLLRNLNLGGSFTYGSQDNPLVPRAFRTASNASNASAADLFSPPFYVFNPNVVERGQRSFWSAHAAYFFRSFSAFADYNGGVLRYAPKATSPSSVDVPANGFSASFGYFLTGESLERRTVVEPLHPFNLKSGKFGLGAFELICRYSTMELGSSAFDHGLSNPDLWTDRAWITNLGVNWYLTRYLKMYIDWQHTEFGRPVIYRQPDIKQLANELFWLRMQFYF